MENLIVIIQYVLAAVGAFALILQAVAKITGVRPGSRPHKRLSKLQGIVQSIVDALGVLALNVGGDNDKGDRESSGTGPSDNRDREEGREKNDGAAT